MLAVGAAMFMLAPAAAQADGQVRAGAAVLDGTYHVGSSAGQYASTRDGGYGDVDPHVQSVKNQASYGVQSRESVRALVVRGGDGRYIAMVSDDHYIPQDALWRRTAQLLDADTRGVVNEKNLTMSVTHNHSSPSYSSLDWGVWSFQDVFDFRFFDYYAHQNAAAVEKALANMHDVRVSATVSRFDAFQKNPMGPGWGDDGSPDGFPRPYTDHDLSVVYFENLDGEPQGARDADQHRAAPGDARGLRPDLRGVPGGDRALCRPRTGRRHDPHAERHRDERGGGGPLAPDPRPRSSSTTPSTARWSGAPGSWPTP